MVALQVVRTSAIISAMNSNKTRGFTIVELLIVIVVIAILASITIVAFNGVQARARDSVRMQKLKEIATALERYYNDNGDYPHIQDGSGNESTCGSQTENWGHCDRNKQLADALAPYMTIDPTSLSSATQGSYIYYYNSMAAYGWQYYGISVNLEGSGGANDGGFMSGAYELGPNVSYCSGKYTGANASWKYTAANTRCIGGN